MSDKLPPVATVRITQFNGEYRFLSNFYICNIIYKDELYSTVEHAYQAQKTLNLEKREQIRTAPTAGAAKRLGRSVKLRSDWNKIKLPLMLELLMEKFKVDTVLGDKLVETGGVQLIEGNNWNDDYWGKCTSKGQNMLGVMLMLVRAENRLFHAVRKEIGRGKKNL